MYLNFCHIDADSFFVSALQRRQPKLKGKPVLATGMGGGCVIAASYEAKAFGVKTGMRLTEAKKLCPRAIAVPSDFDEALMASRQIEMILQNECPCIERYSVDEWFLDLCSVPKARIANTAEWATDVQQSIHRQVGLTVSLGIGPTKILAKMASEYRKPAGITIVEKIPNTKYEIRNFSDLFLCISDFLHDRPIDAIPGIGARRNLHSRAHGWETAWDFAQADPETVKRLFGKPGRELQQEIRGESVLSLETNPGPPKSISRCRSFPRTKDRSIVFSHLLDHLTYTMIKMRRHHLACTAVSVWLRNGEYSHAGKDAKLIQPMDTEDQLLPYIENCFGRLFESGKLYTQVGLALLGLKQKGGTQYSLFEETEKIDRAEHVQEALDAVHEKYGRDALLRGSAVWTRNGKKKQLHIVNTIDDV